MVRPWELNPRPPTLQSNALTSGAAANLAAVNFNSTLLATFTVRWFFFLTFRMEKERQEVERLHDLTEDQWRSEVRNNPKVITNKAVKGKYGFLQKYYHRGAFFLVSWFPVSLHSAAIPDKSPWNSEFSVHSGFPHNAVWPFQKYLAVLPPHTLYNVETRKSFGYTRPAFFVGWGRGWVCMIWKKAPQIDSLCKDRGMLIKSNKTQLRDNIASKPAAWLAGILVSKWCKYAVELLHNDHLGGRRKWPLWTGGL